MRRREEPAEPTEAPVCRYRVGEADVRTDSSITGPAAVMEESSWGADVRTESLTLWSGAVGRLLVFLSLGCLYKLFLKPQMEKAF